MKKILVSLLFLVAAVASFAQIDSINYPARKMPFGNWDFIWTNGTLTDTVKVYPEKGGIGLDTLFFGDGTKQSTAATGGGAQYLVYVALLSQSDTNAPVATILENTLGEVPTFAYNGSGDYTLNVVSAIFLATKTFVFISNVLDTGNPFAIYAGRVSDTSIDIDTYTLNDVLVNTAIEIRVYP